MNCVSAASAARSRVGLTSFAPIEPEVSTIRTTVAPSFASVNFASGLANPRSSSTSATPKIAIGMYRTRPDEPEVMFGSSCGDDQRAAFFARSPSIQR